MRPSRRRRELGRGERVLPGRVPSAPAAAVAGRAARQRVGGRRRRRDRAVRHRHARAGLARPPRTGACDVRAALEDMRLVVCTHAHSDHYGQAATIVERTGCELWMHPNYEHMLQLGARIPTRRSRGVWRWRARAACPRSRCAAMRPSAGEHESGIAAVIEPDRALLPGVTIAHRPRCLDGARDARPRALARVSVPARAAPADLRRPPAGADLAVLRLRLLARPGRRILQLAGRRAAARRAPVPAGSRAHVHRRPRAHRRQPRARARAHSSGCSRRSPSSPLHRLRSRAGACSTRCRSPRTRRRGC